MKKVVLNILKVVIPLLVGVYIIWDVFGQLDQTEKESMFTSIQEAEYGWIVISIIFGIMSHMSRAYRWKYLLAPMGYKPGFINSFFAVMIGYLINLILPRVGEVSRCGVLSKYEKIPFSKLLGTVIAERIADMTILATIIVIVIIVELNTINMLLQSILPQNLDTSYLLMLAGIGFLVCIVLAFIAYQILKRSVNTVVVKIKGLVIGFADGLKSIMKMENSGKFIFHTLFIWFLYIVMFYVIFFTLEETSNVPIPGMLAAFALGGLSLIFIQGGIGIYPAAIMKVLLLYGVAEGPGAALGWIIWTAQTVMLLIFGLFSIVLVSWYNKRINQNDQATPDTVKN
ncbi:MAG: flippase-like domain-containing protein [Flavobacteriales bacterium]|nr:flippase-like domain-containing protein [Flavobacteriales bacterium]